MSKKQKNSNLVLLNETPDMKPDENLVTLLKKILSAAKKGEIVSVSIVCECLDRVYRVSEGEYYNVAEHVLGLEQLKYDLIKIQEKEEEDA